MVYVEKVSVKGKLYYKLVYTKRDGKKITHKSKYIGKELPSKKKLQKIKKSFLKELMNAKYKYILKENLEKIEKKRNNYIKTIKVMGVTEKEKKLEEFMIRFTYDSSKLAGVNVNLRQTYLILKEGIMPKDIHNIKTIKELENHKKGVFIITKYKGSLNIKFIKKLHKILLSGVNDSIAGRLRSELKRDVKLAGTPFVPPKWLQLNKELNNFFKWYKSENRKLHPLELAALIHIKFISLQPFVDGNSRLSRLLMNWILWKKKYPMMDIPIEDLESYYNVVDKYQIEKNEKPFIEYIIKRYLLN